MNRTKQRQFKELHLTSEGRHEIKSKAKTGTQGVFPQGGSIETG